MFIEPIEIALDKPRKFFLSMRALMRAEQEINRRRGVPPAQHASLDFLMWKGASSQVAGTDSVGLDLMVTLLWAGLVDQVEDKSEKLTWDKVLDLIDLSPLTRGKILTTIWNHYNDVTLKRDSGAPSESENNEEGSDPLAPRPGEISGRLQ